jgi:hypothetical protein
MRCRDTRAQLTHSQSTNKKEEPAVFLEVASKQQVQVTKNAPALLKFFQRQFCSAAIAIII